MVLIVFQSVAFDEQIESQKNVGQQLDDLVGARRQVNQPFARVPEYEERRSVGQ